MTDQDKYMKAKEALAAAEHFVNLPRCANCDHLTAKGCTKHGPVPDEYMYTPNECGDFEDIIPF